MKEIILKTIDSSLYRNFISARQEKEMKSLATSLRGEKIYFINSTAFGGGVAELFYSLIPLIRSLGVDIHWYVIEGDNRFFAVTKKIHNLLQGGEGAITPEEIQYYLEVNKKNAEDFNFPVDLVVVHDPQPMPLPLFVSNKITDKPKLIWRCHIDTSRPNPQAKKLIQSFLPWYEKTIFSLDNFARGLGVRDKKIIIYPSIDPLSPKNKYLRAQVSRGIVRKFGVNLNHPFLLQVSRFDPWKDPIGVTDVYRSVKKKVPDVQLVLIGSMAMDDPEGWMFYERTLRHAGEDKEIFIFTNFDGVGSAEVNAFQRSATIILQKSIREGFGLTVSEALWKQKATIGGNVGGIRLQIENGKSGYLVNSNREATEKVEELLLDEVKRERFGEEGHRTVAKKFLTTRHVLDYLKLFKKLVN